MPNFYDGLPDNIPAPTHPALALVSWNLTREGKTARGTIERTKMRIVEKYARLITIAELGRFDNVTDMQILQNAIRLYNQDRATPDQPIGNFLQSLIDQSQIYIRQNGLSVAATDKVEDIFKYLTNTENGVEDKVAREGCSSLFSRLMDQTHRYMRDNNIVLPISLSTAPATTTANPTVSAPAPIATATASAAATIPTNAANTTPTAAAVRAQRINFLNSFQLHDNGASVNYTTGTGNLGSTSNSSSASGSNSPANRP